MRVSPASAWLLLASLLVPSAFSARADGPGSAWDWLSSSDPRPEAARIEPGLSDEEKALALAAWRRSVWTLALSPEGEPPREGSADAAGFVVSEDGVLATSWRVVSSLGIARGRSWLWAREPGGAWARAVPVGSTWLCDLGLVRLVAARRRYAPVAWGTVDRAALGKRFVSVGSALGRDNVVTAASLSSVEWLAAAVPAGRFESRASQPSHVPPKDALAIAMHFPESLAARGGLGSAVFALDGSCVGLVAWADASRPASERTFVRPASLLRPVVERLLADAGFFPADLGVRFGPPPAPPGAAPPLPSDLERVRAAKEKGGALVGQVLETGPALGILWPGDVVLEIEKRPVFGDVYESFLLPLLALRPDVPADVVVWRGGKRATVQVVPRPMRVLYPDAQAEHDTRGASLLLEARGDGRR